MYISISFEAAHCGISMTDKSSRTYTEGESFMLFQQWKNQEIQTNDEERSQKQLPLHILNVLEDASINELKNQFQKYKRYFVKFHHDEWTMEEEINERFQFKIKKHMDYTQDIIKNIYKHSEETRVMTRAATDLHQQFGYPKSTGQITLPEQNAFLSESIEACKQLSVFRWGIDRF